MLILSLFTAYLIGAIPTGFLFAKYLKGIDIRTLGSGNVGATNVYRSIGKGPGFMVLFLDILKGALPVLILPMIFKLDASSSISMHSYKLLIGASSITGHVWTIFLNFKGGKGVATTAGVMLVLAPKVVFVAFILWVIVFAASRYVSLASIIASVSLPISGLAFKMDKSIIVFLLILCVLGIYTHKSNIHRLLKREEHKIKS